MRSCVLKNSEAWVVLKFGGTSVSSAANWHNIAAVVRARIAASFRPVIVHSALSGITDRLESLLAAAAAGNHSGLLEQIETRHRELARALGCSSEPAVRSLHGASCAEAANCWQRGASSSDGLRARVMAMGELLATTSVRRS